MPLTNYAFADLITFTRSTTATFVGSNGLIQSAAINAPRFDFDPVTLAPLGLLMEEQRVNLLLNSDILGTNLSTQNVTVTAQSYTISFYGTGTVTLSGAAIQVVVGTGAYPSRRTLTFTATAGVLTCTVTGTVQFAQLEAGAFATSFIPTAASTVTRARDVATITGANFSPWYNANEGTFIVSFTSRPTAVALVANDGSFNNRLPQMGVGATSLYENFIVASGSVVATLNPAGTHVFGTPATVAVAYAVNNYAASANGGTVVTDTSGALPTGINNLNMGSLQTGASTINGYLRNITYYPTRLTDAQLQALTA